MNTAIDTFIELEDVPHSHAAAARGAELAARGDVLTLDGNAGAIYAGAVRTVMEEPTELMNRWRMLLG
jgi:hypothetical protein